MPLTDKVVRAAKPESRQYKKHDERGLFLLVKPSGTKLWRFRYKWARKEKVLALGQYPEISLKDARQKRDEARSLLEEGVDPSAHRQAQKAARVEAEENNFEAVAREWWEKVYKHEVAPGQAQRNMRRLENHAFPYIGNRPVRDLTPAEVLEVLRRLVGMNQIESAHRLRTLIGKVLRYAIPTGRVDRDVTADLRDALPPIPKEHRPALTHPEEVAPLLQAIEGYSGEVTTLAALRLLPVLFCRPGELRKALWADFDLEAGTWDYKPSKGGAPLLTPLPRQAIEILRDLERVTGRGEYILPANRGRGRPMSENTLNAALKNMGYGGQMVAHGFRAMARTILVERLGYPIEVVEMQLGHAVKDVHGRAYNRATYFDQRRDMLQTWADYLDQLRDGGNVVPIQGAS